MRNTGWTSLQIRNAPRGAVFVWCNNHLGYVRDLARHLDRGDLEIVGLDALDVSSRLMGRNLSGIVLDHAALEKLSPRQQKTVNLLRLQVR